MQTPLATPGNQEPDHLQRAHEILDRCGLHLPPDADESNFVDYIRVAGWGRLQRWKKQQERQEEEQDRREGQRQGRRRQQRTTPHDGSRLMSTLDGTEAEWIVRRAAVASEHAQGLAAANGGKPRRTADAAADEDDVASRAARVSTNKGRVSR